MTGLNKEARSFDIKSSEGATSHLEFTMHPTYMKIIR